MGLQGWPGRIRSKKVGFSFPITVTAALDAIDSIPFSIERYCNVNQANNGKVCTITPSADVIAVLTDNDPRHMIE